jgi:hypothetical protein
LHDSIVNTLHFNLQELVDLTLVHNEVDATKSK